MSDPRADLEAALGAARAQLAAEAHGLTLVAEALSRVSTALGDTVAAYRASLPGPFVDPLSGLPWRSGIGNASDQAVAFATWRGRALGCYAAWTNYSEHITDWAGLAGGPLGQPHIRGALFSKAGSYNLQRAVEIAPPSAPIVWVVPTLPTNFSNARRDDGSWGNPSVWSRLIDWQLERPIVVQVWRELGYRLGQWLQAKQRDPATLTLDLGWEGTASWFPWSIGPDYRSWQVYHRILVDSLREGLLQADPTRGDRVRMQWRVAGSVICDDRHHIETIYPGDTWCDGIGRSLHEKTLRWGTPEGWAAECAGGGPMAKRSKTGRLDGLDAVLAFARSRNRKVALTEWAVQRQAGAGASFPASVDAGGAVRAVYVWCAQHAPDLDHECYLLNKDTSPLGAEAASWAGGQAYRSLWGMPPA